MSVNDSFVMKKWAQCQELKNVEVFPDGLVDVWFEEPGICDNHAKDAYGVSSSATVLAWLRAQAAGSAA